MNIPLEPWACGACRGSTQSSQKTLSLSVVIWVHHWPRGLPWPDSPFPLQTPKQGLGTSLPSFASFLPPTSTQPQNCGSPDQSCLGELAGPWSETPLDMSTVSSPCISLFRQCLFVELGENVALERLPLLLGMDAVFSLVTLNNNTIFCPQYIFWVNGLTGSTSARAALWSPSAY